jgi:phosphoglucosamine mutase
MRDMVNMVNPQLKPRKAAMERQLFGTDGVRGIAGQYPLDNLGAKKIGMAIGSYFARAKQKIVIGCDTRQSSKKLVEYLSSGLIAEGVDVIAVGVITTPGLAYLTREHNEFVAGVMITASHNPYRYNGVKVFNGDGGKLTDKVEAILNKLIVDGVGEKQQGSTAKEEELTKQYEDFLVTSAPDLHVGKLKIAVDCANGSAYGLAIRVFERLGARVTPLFNTPDGKNINAGCGATDTTALSQYVIANKLDLGIAFDGDADRVVMIDKQGRELRGDHLLYILALSKHLKGVVATVMSNLAFEQALSRRKIQLLRTDVGDRSVLQGLKKTGYHLGGEQSGHIILPDLLKTGDGILAAVQVLAALSASGKSLAEWYDELNLFPQTTLNVELGSKELLKSPEIQGFIKNQTKQLTKKGRVLIRASGTEPVIRIMVEAENADQIANTLAVELRELMKEQPLRWLETRHDRLS